ncbi:UNVERIFIED_CONTAM: hypothetical protein FKN15_019597 [Acipenser sinensis]
MYDRAAAVPRKAMAAAEPGPAVVLGLALFSAATTRQFSPLLCSAAYARAAADRQHLVPVHPVLKGEAAPAPLPWVVVEAEAAPAALLLAKAAGAPPLLAAKAVGAPPLLAAKAAGAPSLLAAKAAGAPPLLAAAGETAGMLPVLVAVVEAEPAGTPPLLVEVEPAGILPLLLEVEPAGILPLLVKVGVTSSPPTEVEEEPADGLCCALYDADEDYSETVAENVKKHIQYIPFDENKSDALRVPGFLKDLVETKLQTWVENAFLAVKLKEGREYLVQGKQVLPVDFKRTGIVEMNKKWGDGLQQFLEMKHLTKVSTLSTITNYISNVRYFSMYNGQIYGTTGTLGTESDPGFLHKLYPTLSVCRVPTFNRKKLFEVKGLIRSTKEEWQKTICSVVQKKTTPLVFLQWMQTLKGLIRSTKEEWQKTAVVQKKVKASSYGKGQAALVICEDINKANDLYDLIKDQAPGQVTQYIRNDSRNGNISDRVLKPGDVIVATNLAGRGTDTKVSEEVVKSGGLFVVLSFLSQNARVELQAFGRTARKGQPGSAQVIVCSSYTPCILTMDANIDKMKDARDYRAKQKVEHIMEDDMPDVNLREKLFLKYCSILSGIYESITDESEEKVVVAIMNEYWGTWLQIKSKDIVQLKEKELEESLEIDIEMAKHKSLSSESPLSSIYHYIKFGNNLLNADKIEECAKLLEKAMNLDYSWAAIAFYNHAYCTLKQSKENYLDISLEDLERSVTSLKTLKEQYQVTSSLLQLSASHIKTENKTEFQKNIHIKVQVLDFFEKNILILIKKLKDIKAAKQRKLPGHIFGRS